MIEIATERLVLKKLAAADKDRLVALIGDYAVSRTLCHVPYPYTLQDADEWLAGEGASEYALNIYQEGELIGGIGLTPKERGAAELGYWLGSDYWGRGYGTEAVNGLLGYVESHRTFDKIQASVHRDNALSGKVLEKAGFLAVGEGHDFSLSNQQHVETLNYEYVIGA